MTGVEEAAVLAAVAPEVVGGGMAVGEGLGMLTAAEAGSLLAPELLGSGMAVGEGLGMLGGSELAGLTPFAETAAPAMLGEEALLSSLLGPAPTASMPELFGVGALANTGYAQPFAMGATTAQPGLTGAFGPSTVAAETPWLTGNKAMHLARMAGSMGQQGEQRPMGAPADFSNPLQKPGLLTQEQITKKWLKINAPDVYRRMYGGEGVM